MTRLSIQPYEVPAADLGPDNPLPAFRGLEDGSTFDLNANVPEEDRRYMGWHTAWQVLPYRMQDSYNRNRKPRAFHAAVLENEYVKATVLPEAGGRLVSLVDKTSGRELLGRNPVFQPANLALRNAWLSGGIEWNAGGMPGHHYLTCSPIFAARVPGPGYDVLRLYEWERVKCFPWQVDLHLPPDSRFLFARIRLINPHDFDIAQYWWTNMAVTEQPGARVLFPAETAIGFCDEKQLGLIDLPMAMGRDASYATNVPFAQEMFSRIPRGQRRWVTHLDREGTGFFETSTDRLQGRKMFCWGMNQGGRRWPEFLSAPGLSYVEIQAGLARTQLECLPMPPHAEWTWTEAFGPMAADPAKVHSAKWDEAWRAVDAAIETALPRKRVDEYDGQFATVADTPPSEIFWQGAGWARLERLRAKRQGEPDPIPAALSFDGEWTPDQAMWRALLEDGALPERAPDQDPGETLVQLEWRDLLEASLKGGSGDHWLAWYHLGVMRLENRDAAGAKEAWERSVACKPNGWSFRNLAVLAERAGEKTRHIELLSKAWETGPKIASLAIEYARAFVDAKDYKALQAFVRNAPEEIRSHERIRVMSAQAALEQGDTSGLEELFEHDFATNREGEVTLTDLWFTWHEIQIAEREGIPKDDADKRAELKRRVRKEFPPPARIDFRMVSEVN